MVSNDTYASLDDAELMLRVQADDTYAFAALYDRFAGLAYRLAVRLLPDEVRAGRVIEETFVAVWTGRAEYGPSTGPVNAWIAGTMRDRMRAHHVPKGA